MTNERRPGDRLQRFSSKITWTRYSPVENPTCTDFEEYGEVPETVPLEFKEDDVRWVASHISGAVGALRAEAIEMRNWILRFGCALEELWVVVAILDDLMANSSPHWATYRALMACRLVALDKIPRVRPVGIMETLFQALDKLVMRASGTRQRRCLVICSCAQASRPAYRVQHTP